MVSIIGHFFCCSYQPERDRASAPTVLQLIIRPLVCLQTAYIYGPSLPQARKIVYRAIWCFIARGLSFISTLLVARILLGARLFGPPPYCFWYPAVPAGNAASRSLRQSQPCNGKTAIYMQCDGMIDLYLKALSAERMPEIAL